MGFLTGPLPIVAKAGIFCILMPCEYPVFMKNSILPILLVCLLFSSASYAQADSLFTSQKQVIDEQVLAIESDTLLSQTPLSGTLMWGDFKANSYYILKTKKLLKLEFFFSDSAAGKKIFYFHDHNLIKITDKGTDYYYINFLRDNNGNAINRSIERDLLFFTREMKKMTLGLL